MEAHPAIEVANLTKSFDGSPAVNDLSFLVRTGEFFGFLGPNGAGKTTTINILTGLARPDMGSIRISGRDCSHDHKASQDLIGVVPDESNLYPELTGFDNLCFCASLYGMPKVQRLQKAKYLLETFGLAQAGNKRFGAYSKGMKRKLTIAAGIIHDPRILFMDEPTTGIDVGSARQIRQMVSGLHKAGTTIFLTTHYIEEAERLCERIAFIVAGKIVRTDTVDNLLQPLQGKNVMLVSLSASVLDVYDKFKMTFTDWGIELTSPDQVRIESLSTITVFPIASFFEDKGLQVLEAKRVHLSLEDVFVKTTGIEIDAMRKEREKPNPNQ